MIFSYTETIFTFCLTNTIACRPTETDYRGEIVNRVPTEAEMDLCKPRLDQLIESWHFNRLVYVGKTAESYRHVLPSQPGLFTKAITILHPAAIYRMEYKVYSIKKQAEAIDKHVKTYTSQGGQTVLR